MDSTTVKSAFDASVLILAAGGVATTAVELIKRMFELTDRGKVASAIASSFALVALFALSNGLLVVANAFSLVAAWLAVSATAAGIYASTSAVIKNGN